jgi:hypothetical protein
MKTLYSPFSTMNAPREGVYDRVTAGALVKGAAACYGDEAAMRLWGRTQGCEECQVVRDERTDTLAFAAANETEVFVCFRGTRDLRNWITDLDCGLTSASSVEPRIADCGLEGGIHAGFYRALEAVWGELAAVLERMAAGRKNIFFCGHSLGGALAMLAAARWEGRGGAGNSAAISGSLPRAATWMYSFGQPRVGNRAWARIGMTHGSANGRSESSTRRMWWRGCRGCWACFVMRGRRSSTTRKGVEHVDMAVAGKAAWQRRGGACGRNSGNAAGWRCSATIMSTTYVELLNGGIKLFRGGRRPPPF